jgi:hypothetical protein
MHGHSSVQLQVSMYCPEICQPAIVGSLGSRRGIVIVDPTLRRFKAGRRGLSAR